MQFPPFFAAKDARSASAISPTSEGREMLAPAPVLVEFRHPSWVEAGPGADARVPRGPRHHVRGGRRAAVPGTSTMPPVAATEQRRLRAPSRPESGYVTPERLGLPIASTTSTRRTNSRSGVSRFASSPKAPTHLGHVQQLQVRLRAAQRARDGRYPRRNRCATSRGGAHRGGRRRVARVSRRRLRRRQRASSWG